MKLQTRYFIDFRLKANNNRATISMRHVPKRYLLPFAALFFGFVTLNVTATTYYVSVNSTNPTPPYTDWSIAATNIQDAINLANPGDLVLVTNGVYSYGGQHFFDVNNPFYPTILSRVQIPGGVNVSSVNGPSATIIQGNGIHCACLISNSILSGFTLTNGSAPLSDLGGGAYCLTTNALISNCIICSNYADAGGGVYLGTLTNCILINNQATYISTSQNPKRSFSGGGACGSILNKCTLSGNIAAEGGGAYNCTLNYCTIIGNTATNLPPIISSGGGAFGGTVNNCIISSNAVGQSNTPGGNGGGCCSNVINNSLLVYNSAGPDGISAAFSCALTNCTVCDNVVPYNSDFNALLEYSVLRNCIIYYNTNTGPIHPIPGYGTTNFQNCCVQSSGFFALAPNNTTNAPLFVGAFDFHLKVFSPCIDTGDDTSVVGDSDLDGNPRVVNGTVDMGAYEFQGSVHYVDANGSNPTPPYLTWATAATTIQDAVDAATNGDGILVTNGVYQTGGRTENGYSLTNRVAIDQALTVVSVNGPAVTIIQGFPVIGANAVRCAYVTNGATLSGFTLTNGATLNDGDGTNEQCGGGVLCESASAVVSNCVICFSSATYYGGGAYQGTLENCILCSNQVTYFGNGSGGGVDSAFLVGCTISNNFSYYGGGAENSALLNCTLTGNYDYIDDDYTANGGGVCNCELTNCLITANSALTGAGASSSTLVNCTLTANTTEIGDGVWPPNGGGAENCTLINCTLMNNIAVQYGGGGESCLFYNCVLSGNTAGNGGGGADNGTLCSCTLSNNAAFHSVTNIYTSYQLGTGGGANNAVLNGCTLIGNISTVGGGAESCALNNCILSGNGANTGSGGGGGADTCVLSNCTLSANQALYYGGGASYSTLNNCSLISNTVTGQDGQSGGADNSYLTNCVLIGNSLTYGSGTYGGGSSASTIVNSLICSNSADIGGGAEGCILQNCTVVENSATSEGGGEDASALNSCIVYYNIAPLGANHYDSACSGGPNPCAPIDFCCTYPLPGPSGNITNAPSFVDLAGGDFHLQTNSPCINSGNNAYVPTATDLDGNPRVVGGTVDQGCYEYQTPTSVISYAWLQQYGLPTDGSVDTADLDGTAFNVYQDWIAGLNPTNSASVLAMLTPSTTNNASGITVSWQSVSGISYNLLRSTNLSAQPAFSTIQSSISGQAGTTSYTDTTATNNVPYFYRVGVQ